MSGLNDIDLDDPPAYTDSSKPSNDPNKHPLSVFTPGGALDDFFGPGATISKPIVTANINCKSQEPQQHAKHDIDDFFTNNTSRSINKSEGISNGNDLFDLSATPVQRQKYMNDDPTLFVRALEAAHKSDRSGNRVTTLGQIKGFKDLDTVSIMSNPVLLKRMNYYEILGVVNANACDNELISQLYKKKALELHPDKFKSKHGRPQTVNEEEYFKAVVKAYEVLSDSDLREEYDQWLAEGRHNSNAGVFEPRQKVFQHANPTTPVADCSSHIFHSPSVPSARVTGEDLWGGTRVTDSVESLFYDSVPAASGMSNNNSSSRDNAPYASGEKHVKDSRDFIFLKNEPANMDDFFS
eukprot:Tbor_TRINITY_DN91_c0_g1::TRINITY_DN91_c0_g1_i1::g.15100::m.15100